MKAKHKNSQNFGAEMEINFAEYNFNLGKRTKKLFLPAFEIKRRFAFSRLNDERSHIVVFINMQYKSYCHQGMDALN